VTLATAAYAFGNCTYYVATRFPTIYPYLGNAKDWILNAPKHGYQVLTTPHPDTVVVYGPGNGYSSLGHVAVVDKVNPDGSFQVSEMNYAGFDHIDQRRSTMKGVIGFIVPPGSTYTPTAAVAAAAASAASNAGGCVVGSIDVLGVKICMDGVLGVATIAIGGLLILSGVAVFVAFALAKTGAVAKITQSVGPLAGPWGAVASLATRTSTPKAKPTQPTPAEGKAASEARVSVAKARLSSGTQAEVDAAARGEGKRLSPEAREELKRVG
jgi:CHAP domain